MKNRVSMLLTLLLGTSTLFGAASQSINDLPEAPTPDEINAVKAMLQKGLINAPADEDIIKSWAAIRTQLINSVIQKKRSLSDALYRQNEGIVPYALEKRNSIGTAIALTIARNNQFINSLFKDQGKATQQVFESNVSLIPTYPGILFNISPFPAADLRKKRQNLQIYFSQPLSDTIKFGIIQSLNSFAKATKWYTAFELVKPLVDYNIIKPTNESLINFILDSLSFEDQAKFKALLEEKAAGPAQQQPAPKPTPAPAPQVTKPTNLQAIFNADSAKDIRQGLSTHKDLANVPFKEDGRLYSPLIYAVDSDNSTFYTTYAKILLDNGADVNWQDEDGNTALIYAAMGGDDKAAAVQLLIDHGADKTIRNKQGFSALSAAMQSEHLAEQILKSLNEAEVQKLLASNNALAKRSPKLDLERSLLAHVTTPDQPKPQPEEQLQQDPEAAPAASVNLKNILDTFANTKNKAALAQEITHHKALVNTPFESGEELYSPLSYAAILRDTDASLYAMDILLKHGADINGQAQPGSNTALMDTAGQYHGNRERFERIQFLLAKGADPTIRNAAHQSMLSLLLGRLAKDVPIIPDLLKLLSDEDIASLLASNTQHTHPAQTTLAKTLAKEKEILEEEVQRRKPVFEENLFFEQKQEETLDDIRKRLEAEITKEEVSPTPEANKQEAAKEDLTDTTILNLPLPELRSLGNEIQRGRTFNTTEAQQLITLATTNGKTPVEKAKQRAAISIIMGSRRDTISPVTEQAIITEWNRIARRK